MYITGEVGRQALIGAFWPAFDTRYAASPSLLLKIRNPSLLPVGLEIDLGRADDPLAIKALEDRLVEPETPQVREPYKKYLT